MEDSMESMTDPFTAVQSGNLPLLKVLLLNGIGVQIQDKNGSTLLHHAVTGGSQEIIKFLIEKGVDASRVNKVGETVLHIAASKNRFDIANILLETVNHDEISKFIDAKTITSGSTALHIASRNGFHNIAMSLLSRGATYSIKNKKDKQPIDVATDKAISELLTQVIIYFEQAKIGQEKLYESLEKCSVDEFSAFVNTRNFDGYNLVQTAIVNNHPNLATLIQCLKVALFRRHGHRPTFKTNYFDELLLLATNVLTKLQDNHCILETFLKYVRQFVSTFRYHDKRILDPNVVAIEDMLRLLENCKDAASFLEHSKQVVEVHLKLFSASIYSVKLLESTRRKNWTLAEKCMSEMAYVNLDEGGWTPLLHAINAGNQRIVKMLIDHGARVNCSTKMGKNTSLHIAVNSGHFGIAELLLEKDSSSEFVNAKTEAKGSTALHIAAKFGRTDIVMWLLKCRATYCMKNKDGKMPEDLTSDESIKRLFNLIEESFNEVKTGKVEMIDKLESLGDDEFLAVVLCQNEDGHLLKDVALMNKHDLLANKITDMLKVLLSQKGFKFNGR